MNIVSLSGGKDSCATALTMLENGVPIDLLVWVDVGRWEFPETKRAVYQVAEITGAELVVLHPPPFDWWMSQRLVKKKDGSHTFGAGWPSRQHGRWCSREKFETMDKYLRLLNDPVRFVGFASDEAHRVASKELVKRRKRGEKYKFPLIDFGITEEMALQKCYSYGIDWDNLYEIFRDPGGRTPRLSCWCCPHQPLYALRILRTRFPHYWSEMLQMSAKTPQKVFKGWVGDGTDQTVEQLEARFSGEDCTKTLDL